MKAYLYIENDHIGEVDFSITDKCMGGVGGNLIPNSNYKKYKPTIQKYCDTKGISNIDDYNYKIFLADNSELKPEGGIGIADLKGFDEIYVECAELNSETIEKMKISNNTKA